MGHRFPPGVAMLQVRTLDTNKPFAISKRTHNVGRAVEPTEGQGHARLSPFTGVRWVNTDCQVQVDGTWYELVAIDDQPFANIVEFAKKKYGDAMVQKRIDEDLVEVLTATRHKPGEAVKLQLRSLDTGAVITREKVPMTKENRERIFDARQGNPSAVPAPATGTQGL
jgi:hypothetical protein